jgi:large subunit ribosomal protein L15
LPLIKRLPRKRGFTNIFKTEYEIVNVGQLKTFPPNAEVTPQVLFNAGLVKHKGRPVKVLGEGVIDRPLVVRASKFSASAERKILAVGGKVESV